MSRLALQLIKLAAYFVFGYIPLLIICVIVSAAIAAFIVQSIDYCYGSMACLGHGFAILIIGLWGGFSLSLIVIIMILTYRENQKKPKQKRKPE